MAGRFRAWRSVAPCRKSRAQQNTLGTFCVAVSAPLVELNFFFTKKWVGGRLFLRRVSAWCKIMLELLIFAGKAGIVILISSAMK